VTGQTKCAECNTVVKVSSNSVPKVKASKGNDDDWSDGEEDPHVGKYK